jgi:hypothetical protein
MCSLGPLSTFFGRPSEVGTTTTNATCWDAPGNGRIDNNVTRGRVAERRARPTERENL